jgi:hypothetical protein
MMSEYGEHGLSNGAEKADPSFRSGRQMGCGGQF